MNYSNTDPLNKESTIPYGSTKHYRSISHQKHQQPPIFPKRNKVSIGDFDRDSLYALQLHPDQYEIAQKIHAENLKATFKVKTYE